MSVAYKRKHISRNFYIVPDDSQTHYHPETEARMAEHGLTREKMMSANNARHWRAMQKIRRVYKELQAVRVGYISVTEIAIAARTHHRRVKQALGLTDEEISLQLRIAFIHSSSTVVTDINIIDSVSLENSSQKKEEKQPAFNAGSGRLTEAPRMSSNKTLAEMQAVWFARANGGDTRPPLKTTIEGESVAEKRKKDLEEHTRKYMQEIQRKKEEKRNGPEASIKMTPSESRAWLDRKKSPGRYEETEEQIKKRLELKKNGFPEHYEREKPRLVKPEAQQYVRGQKLPEDVKKVPPAEPDWEAAYIYDQKIKEQQRNEYKKRFIHAVN